MDKFVIFWVCVALVFSVTVCSIQGGVYAQIQPTKKISSNTTSSNGTGVVSVSATVTMPVSNETLDTKDRMLRTAVISFLNSGANVLKMADSDQPIVKTKIANEINKAIQNVEGTEATNAIIGVEVTKSLKSVNLRTVEKNHANSITISTSSTCKLVAIKSISCDNVVTIK